ncbi:endolytic transglycosylase MltG [Actinoplanes oblitus]|uniref:Endolytic murein transglycosylase n=1 Tax=Actinoplanes oblitus TaxID=3040509 RepID=A0ABY8WG70_9ACTN|nr:endolytic transglycosylase MltG [Actinoplanes oblitus]WIM94710.1 endolytic transglycosylase MltG [Actinoplanes oblitus]
MIDELDAAFDGAGEDPGRWRHRKKKGGGRTLLTMALVIVLLGALGGGAYFGIGKVKGFFSAEDYPGPGTGSVVVEVKSGDTATAIANTLYKLGVVKSAAAFVDAAKDNPKSKDIQVGSYLLRKEMKAADALTALLDLKNKNVNKVTIPEGLISLQIFDKLSQATKIPAAEFKKAAKDPQKLGVPALWFKRQDGKKVDKTNIEGFLYPATYEFPKDANATQILQTMIKHFNAEMDELDFANQATSKLHISPYEALVAGSIAQVEALLPEDMGPVARVLYNRAYLGTFPCGCLQLDSTVNYWLRISGKDAKASEKLLASELHDPKNPYSYDVKGMAIGPISNPGEVALKGAINAPKNQFFFFVTIDKKGTMAYGKTNDEHRANIRKACKNGIPLCGN